MSTKWIIPVALAVLAGCAAPASDTPSAGEPAEADPEPIPGVLVLSSPAPPRQSYEFTIAILEDARYQYANVTASPEAKIIWWNTDDEVHSVVSDDGRFAGSGPVAPGSEFAYTFLTAGDYPYHCRYHPHMTGIVNVR